MIDGGEYGCQGGGKDDVGEECGEQLDLRFHCQARAQVSVMSGDAIAKRWSLVDISYYVNFVAENI